MDLGPLNSRVHKQNPFPIIENCLALAGEKSVFMLLDLLDGFHQIKVNEAHTKYFAFVTPNGQFKYRYLPFGYLQAFAEF